MRVRLTHIDGKLPNLALMRLASYHRAEGHAIYFSRDVRADLFDEPGGYDAVYGSSIFRYSADRQTEFLTQFPDALLAGTGTDSRVQVEEISGAWEDVDYSIYPEFKHNIGFTMRGCRFRCDFCVVPRKEGRPYSTNTIADLLVQDSDFLILLDNDPFGNPEWRDRFDEIRDRGLRVNFSQGVNIRVITPEQAAALASVNFRNLSGNAKQVNFAWDQPKDEGKIVRGIDRCVDAGIKPWQMQFFVLIGWHSTPEEDLHRVMWLLDKGCDPYVMPYDKHNAYQRAFARWVNRRLCKTIPWKEYTYGDWKPV